MEATQKMKLDTLKRRIARRDYEVDADAVAEAIVERLLAARGSFLPCAGDGPPAGPSAVETG